MPTLLLRTALLLCVAPSLGAAAADEPPVPSSLDVISTWLQANFDLPPAPAPRLRRVSATELVEIRYGDPDAVPAGDVVALYDGPNRTILLDDGWTGRSPEQLSVLVHELVHHLQDVSGMRFACPAEREVLAYRAQDAWLRMFGSSLDASFGLQPADVRFMTICTY